MKNTDTIDVPFNSYKRHGNPLTLFGLYRGILVDREDPEKLGRCKIKVYQVHDNIPDDDLPWAWPKFKGAGHAKSGSFHVPPKSTTVYVEFEMGDPDHPVWDCGYWGKPEGKSEVPDKCHDQDGKPDNYIWETPGGHYIELDDRKGVEKVRIRTSSGHEIIMDETVESDERSDSDNPDSIQYKQKGIHVFTAGGHQIHMQDEDDRSGGIKGIRLEDYKGNYIQMNDTNNLLKLYWNGNCEYNITGNVTGTIGGFWSVTVSLAISFISAAMNIMNGVTSAIVGTWSWSGSMHSRNGNTSDSKFNSHGR